MNTVEHCMVESGQGGAVRYSPADVLSFPAGLPGFRELRSFVVTQPEGIQPLVYLQSLLEPYVRFILVPGETIAPQYRLEMEPWDAAMLASDGAALEEGALRIHFVLSIDRENKATVNMLAPVVIHEANRRGVQAVRSDSIYSHAEPLVLARIEQE